MTHAARPHLEFTQSFRVKSGQERADVDVIEDNFQSLEEVPIRAVLPFPKNTRVHSVPKVPEASRSPSCRGKRNR